MTAIIYMIRPQCYLWGLGLATAPGYPTHIAKAAGEKRWPIIDPILKCTIG